MKIVQIALLVAIISNLLFISFLAYAGKKNLLLPFAILEAALALILALTYSSQ
ncbi:MAG: hypothetical protein QME12_09040 [Nanoarchaeota archaeon]|nr:hypothetical protein [Nanoarchaeota archaeon]